MSQRVAHWSIAIAAITALLVPVVAAAQPDDEVPTIIIEGGGLDIWGGAQGPDGRSIRGRPAADFELLFTLERDFVDQIAEDAKADEL